MRRYRIFLVIEEYGDEELIKKQFKAVKKKFLTALEPELFSKQIIISKTQETLNAIFLSIEEPIDKVIEKFRQMKIVAEIDPEYKGK